MEMYARLKWITAGNADILLPPKYFMGAIFARMRNVLFQKNGMIKEVNNEQ